MERVLTVNASPDRKNPGGEFGIGSIDDVDDFGIATPSGAGISSTSADQGPCLYLGPRGQRCARRATKGGFCALHQPDAPVARIAKPSKKLAASILAIIAVIWPYLADVLREVLRWIHAH